MFKLLIALLLAAAASVFAANATGTYSVSTGVTTFTQMTAPETTSAIEVGQNAMHVCHVKVATINTSVTLYVEGSLDGSNWFNLDVNEASSVRTANGVYAYRSTAKVKWWRARWSAEAGGTDAKMDIQYFGGAQ